MYFLGVSLGAKIRKHKKIKKITENSWQTKWLNHLVKKLFFFRCPKRITYSNFPKAGATTQKRAYLKPPSKSSVCALLPVPERGKSPPIVEVLISYAFVCRLKKNAEGKKSQEKAPP